MAKILICDDDMNFFQAMSDFLRALGHEVFPAADPAHLMVVARANKPDLIFMDMQMPGGGGPQAIKNLLTDPQLAVTPILFCSGMPEHHLKGWFPASPIRRYVKKPADLLLLKELVADLIRKGKEQGPQEPPKPAA